MHKIVQYRSKCIGCAVCFEQQPEFWRMSKKDGKATLIKAMGKKNIFILAIPDKSVEKAKKIADACPVRIIKVL